MTDSTYSQQREEATFPRSITRFDWLVRDYRGWVVHEKALRLLPSPSGTDQVMCLRKIRRPIDTIMSIAGDEVNDVIVHQRFGHSLELLDQNGPGTTVRLPEQGDPP